MEKIYKTLNKYRLSKNMSMAQFAKLIGVNYWTVYRALMGLNKPHDYHATKFKKYYSRHRKEMNEN